MSSPSSSDRISSLPSIIISPALLPPAFKVAWVCWDVQAFVKMPAHVSPVLVRLQDIQRDPRLTIVVDAQGQRPKSWVMALELAGLGQSS